MVARGGEGAAAGESLGADDVLAGGQLSMEVGDDALARELVAADDLVASGQPSMPLGDDPLARELVAADDLVARAQLSMPPGDDALARELVAADDLVASAQLSMPLGDDALARELDANGFAVLPDLLTPEQCVEIAAMYADDARFRSRVVMARHGFGRGEYKYFAYPLPPVVEGLRVSLYARLAPIANRWGAALGGATYPDTLEEFRARCRAAGQVRPTPLLLRYERGDYNCLHQDLYGELVFPLQVACLLAEPGRDFTGGELVMTEQRPRMQSRPMVVPLRQGDAVAFAVNERPVAGTRGTYRVRMRHGVSRVHGGRRHTLGIIFHDAKE